MALQIQAQQRQEQELAQYERGAADTNCKIADCEVFHVRGSESAKVIVPESGHEHWIGGTGPGNRFIQPHSRSPKGEIYDAHCDSTIRIDEVDELVKLLDLKPSVAPGVFKRKGFTGDYLLQTESDGTLSLHYEGGRHVSGRRCRAQTFHHGQWDRDRELSIAESKAAQQALVDERKRLAELKMPKVTDEGTYMPGLGAHVVVKTPEKPMFDFDITDPLKGARNPGDYHIPDAYTREMRTIADVSETAAGVLTQEENYRLEEIAGDEPVLAGSRKARVLLNETLAMVNDRTAQSSYLIAASDEFKEKLGLPKGTKLLLSKSGEVEVGDKYLEQIIDRGFGSTIRIRGRSGPVARDGDVVIMSVHRGSNSEPYFMRMSVVRGSSEKKENWVVQQRDAVYRSAPELYVRWSVDRNPDSKTIPFSEWLEKNQQWYREGSKQRSLVDALFEEKLAVNKEARLAAEREAEALAKRREAAAKQSAQFARVTGSHFRTNHEGVVVNQYYRTDAAFTAPETRTGTFTVNPSANLHFVLQRGETTEPEVTINSETQISRMSAQNREFYRHLISTPIEGDAERSLTRVISLFPHQNYRPGLIASGFYNKRWYNVELRDGLLPKYNKLSSPEERRSFLKKLYSELQSAGTVTESLSESLPKKF